jgi:hypothetical protein
MRGMPIGKSGKKRKPCAQQDGATKDRQGGPSPSHNFGLQSPPFRYTPVPLC